MALQHNFKSPDGFEKFKQTQASKAEILKDQLVRDAENRTISYLTSQYGSARLDRESKVELVARKGLQDQLVYDGTVTVHAQISAGAAAKRLSLTSRVAHNTVSLPKFKFVAKLVEDTKVEGELREVLATTKPSNLNQQILVDLAAFKLVKAEGGLLEAFHPVYGQVSLGKMSELEYTATDKTPELVVGYKGVFRAAANKVLANKAFEVKDLDGDLVLLEVGKTSGWIDKAEIPYRAVDREVKLSQLDLGERVYITSELKEYYGDNITAADVVGKEATIARLSDTEIVLSVDRVAEDVVLDRKQSGVLQQVVVSTRVLTPVKLEALLRDMVVDRFSDRTIKFVGKFQAPEPLDNSVPNTILTEKKAAIEDKEMTPDNLDLKFRQTSGFDKFIASEVHKVANKKRGLEEKASSELVMALNQSYSPARHLGTTSTLSYEYDKGHSGTVTVQAEVMDRVGIKRIAVEIPFVNDTYVLPKSAELDKLVSATQSEQDKFTVTNSIQVAEKCAAIDAEVAFNAHSVAAALEGPSAKPQPRIDKTAGTGALQPQEAQIQPVFKLNKAFLPASLQVGAVIDLSGIRYKLTSKGGDTLSKGSDDGSHWTFERLQSNSDEPASYRDNN